MGQLPNKTFNDVIYDEVFSRVLKSLLQSALIMNFTLTKKYVFPDLFWHQWLWNEKVRYELHITYHILMLRWSVIVKKKNMDGYKYE